MANYPCFTENLAVKNLRKETREMTCRKCFDEMVIIVGLVALWEEKNKINYFHLFVTCRELSEIHRKKYVWLNV